ncbi:hypothetical protein ACM66B_001765 [Microbotryomycetes sp. NB124-2]
MDATLAAAATAHPDAAKEAIDAFLHEAQASVMHQQQQQQQHDDNGVIASGTTHENVLRRRLLEAKSRMESATIAAANVAAQAVIADAAPVLSTSELPVAAADNSRSASPSTSSATTALVPRSTKPTLPSIAPEAAAVPTPNSPKNRIQELPASSSSSPPPTARYPAHPSNPPPKPKPSDSVRSMLLHLATAGIQHKKLQPLLESTMSLLVEVSSLEQQIEQQAALGQSRQQHQQNGPSSASTRRQALARDLSDVIAQTVRQTLDETLEDWRLTVLSSLQVLENKVDQLVTRQERHHQETAYPTAFTDEEEDDFDADDQSNGARDDDDADYDMHQDDKESHHSSVDIADASRSQHKRSTSAREITILTEPAAPPTAAERQTEALATPSEEADMGLDAPAAKAMQEQQEPVPATFPLTVTQTGADGDASAGTSTVAAISPALRHLPQQPQRDERRQQVPPPPSACKSFVCVSKLTLD